MDVTRRNFLKVSGMAAGSVLLPSSMAASLEKVRRFPLHKPIKEAATICPYCSCGCGLLISTVRMATSSMPKVTRTIPRTAAHSIPNPFRCASSPRARSG